MFESICSLPLPHDVFTTATSPRDPLLAVGLSSGHVYCYKLPPIDEEDVTSPRPPQSNRSISNGILSPPALNGERRSSLASDNGYGFVETAWKTRRHKDSCRSVGFSIDGEHLYTAGADGIVKVAKAETGKVEWKIAVPNDSKGQPDAPTLLHVLSPQTLLLATDSSALHLYDIRAPSSDLKPQATHKPHDDYISSLTPLPPTSESTSGFSKVWVTTGGTTLAATDLRKGVIARSEDQEEELLSSAFVDGFRKKGTSVGEKVVVGGADGVLTLWEKGVWDDQDERIIVDKGPGGGESIDCLARIPHGVASKSGGGDGKTIVCGMGNGFLAMVKIGQNKVVDVLKHDEVEGVVSLNFDVGGRMISGGGGIVKVWRELDTDRLAEMAAAAEDVNEAEDNVVQDDEEEEPNASTNGAHSRKRNQQSDSDSSQDNDSSEEERKPREKRKKKKKARGITKTAPPKKLSFAGLD